MTSHGNGFGLGWTQRAAATLAIAISLVLCGSLGCTSGRGPGTKTTVGALGGAAAGGLLGSAVGDGKAMAAGAILGGLLGAGIGNYLDQRDHQYMAQTTYDALEYAPLGETRSWRNPDSGHYGQVTPVETYESSDGRDCREFRQQVVIEGRQETAHGSACRQADGTWRIAS